MIASRDILIEKLQKENAALKEQKKQDRKNLYGTKSQKISRKNKEEVPSHEENKDDFDETSLTVPHPPSVGERKNSLFFLATAEQISWRSIIRYCQHAT